MELRAAETSATTGNAERRRDLLKEWARMSDGGATYAILGLEEQMKGHLAMLARCALYDAMAYRGQIDALARRNRREGMAGASPAEFLSGMWEHDQLRPVVTLVLYLSPDEWVWPETLHGTIGVDVDKRLMAFVPDYRMNLVAPARMSDDEFDSFSTELGLVLKYVRHSSDDEDLDTMVHEDGRYASVDVETATFLNAITNSSLVLEEKGGRIDMCKAIDDMRRKSELKGERRGERRGERKNLLNNLRSLLAHTGWELPRAFDALDVPESERASLAAELGAAS